MQIGAKAVETAGNHVLRRYLGYQLRVHGLTSARGLEINGMVGECVGFTPIPEARLHIRLPGFDAPFKVKLSNLLDPETDADVSEPKGVDQLDLRSCTDVDPAVILRAARTDIGKRTAEGEIRSCVGAGRADMRYRATSLLACLEDLKKGVTGAARTRFKCGETGPEALSDPFVRNMMQMKPGCVGNGTYDLHDLYDGGADDYQAALRLAEFPMSGFCVPCQMQYLESESAQAAVAANTFTDGNGGLHVTV